jgi:hypothetical membrane protein
MAENSAEILPPYPESARNARLLALGGVIGPVAFVSAWLLTGLNTTGYSPVARAISRLAAAGAPTRSGMTAGFVIFGIGVVCHGLAIRKALPGWSWAALVTTGLATIGAAVFPLDAADDTHGAFAGIGYVTLALAPLLAVKVFRSQRPGWAGFSLIIGTVVGLCLVISVFGPDDTIGLFQRIGLTAGDVWIVATAVDLLRTGHLVESPQERLTPP